MNVGKESLDHTDISTILSVLKAPGLRPRCARWDRIGGYNYMSGRKVASNLCEPCLIGFKLESQDLRKPCFTLI